MKILLPTYKRIGWIVKAYAHLHEKYWGESVILLAEEDYSEGRLDFVRPPLEELILWDAPDDTPGEIPGRHFTDILIWYLRLIEDEHVIIMLSDYLITAPVNTELIKQLQEYMELNNVLRGNISCDGGFCNGQVTDTYKDLEIWEGNFLPTSLTPAMWDRKLLLEMMKWTGTAWSFELNGRDKFPWGGCRSIAPSPGMLRYINSLRGRSMTSMVMTRAVYAEVAKYLEIKTQQFID